MINPFRNIRLIDFAHIIVSLTGIVLVVVGLGYLIVSIPVALCLMALGLTMIWLNRDDSCGGAV